MFVLATYIHFRCIKKYFYATWYCKLVFVILLFQFIILCYSNHKHIGLLHKHFNIYHTFSYSFSYFIYRIRSLAHSQEHWMRWILKGCFLPLMKVTMLSLYDQNLSCIVNAYFRIISQGLTFSRQHYVALCQPVITSHKCQWCSKASGGSREAVISDLYKDKKREKICIYGGAICAVYNKF